VHCLDQTAKTEATRIEEYIEECLEEYIEEHTEKYTPEYIKDIVHKAHVPHVTTCAAPPARDNRAHRPSENVVATQCVSHETNCTPGYPRGSFIIA
jgi:hypothetical protein